MFIFIEIFAFSNYEWFFEILKILIFHIIDRFDETIV